MWASAGLLDINYLNELHNKGVAFTWPTDVLADQFGRASRNDVALDWHVVFNTDGEPVEGPGGSLDLGHGVALGSPRLRLSDELADAVQATGGFQCRPLVRAKGIHSPNLSRL